MIAQDISFCLFLIGKPWVSGASGPEAFDCWGLLRHVLRERRGIELCPYGGVKETGLAGMIRNAEAEAQERWELIATPVHLCCVAMARGRRIEHVGLWLDEGAGGVLHSHEGAGVVFQSPASIRNTGFQNFTFYQFRP
jgi:cell wall-associated NlpC family hydrolase